MIKFASELKLRPVLLRKEQAFVGVVEDVIVNTDTGELVGILLREGFGKKNQKVVAEKDIETINSKFFLIKGYDVIGDVDEIVRVKEALDRKINITGNKVYTVGGTYLGKVADYTIDLSTNRIGKIYVNPSIINPLLSQKIISFSQIVSIEKEKITVEDATIKDAEKVVGRLSEPAS